MAPRVIPVDPFDLVVFGATGDLAMRKIYPALYRRFVAGQMPPSARIIGAARADQSDAEFKDTVADHIRTALGPDVDKTELPGFLSTLGYVSVDANSDKGWPDLAAHLRADVTRCFYFSVAPSLFGPLAQNLHRWGLAGGDARVVVEKPFGHDLHSAKGLNRALAAHFDESQVYRIDHYLGKETVQNLMVIRFGNMLFEPLWNSQYVDHIQITVAESLTVAGRAAYYDGAGAMRDMVQNHLMQLLCLTAMEPPAKFEPQSVRDEKVKVIRALEPVQPHHIVRGQYEDGQGGGFRADVNNPKSHTESFVALKLSISNWRWAGTPFYLRTGKALSARASEIAVVFKDAPHSIFGPEAGRHANVLTIRLQPNEGITMGVTIKEPGPGGMRLMDVPLDMSFAKTLGPSSGSPTDAYERLIMDVIRGDQTLFMRADEVEAAWAWTDPIIAGWQARADVPKTYASGSSGPSDASLLMSRDGRAWRKITA